MYHQNRVKMMDVACLFRNSAYFSMERLFHTLMPHLNQECSVGVEVMPCRGGKPAALYRNLCFCRNLRGYRLFHITGDINYVACTLPGERTILTVHDLGNLEAMEGSWKRPLLRRFWYQYPLAKVAAVTCVSETTRRLLLDAFPCDPAKVSVIYNPVDPGFSFEPKPFNRNRPRILFLGSKPNKNLPRVIQALRGISCHLRVIGVPGESGLRMLRENEIDYSTASRLSDEEIIEEYRRCDLLCFPSTLEGFGLPIVEAQAIGRPVLTGNVSAMPETAGEGGALLVDPFQVGSIRQGILDLINQVSLREKLIAAGKANVKRFLPETIAGQYLELYRETAARVKI